MVIDETGVPQAMSRLYGAVLLAATLAACGPGVGPGGDAGADAGDTGDGSVEITPPDIPWLEEGAPPIAPPLLTPCPEGWHEVVELDPDSEMDVATCDPYGTEPGGTEPDTCPEGQAHFTGDPGCTPVGAPCPVGDFPGGLPSDGVVLYVLAGAPPGGDGSEAAPLSTITEGLALASRGAIVAIGKGEYDEALRLPEGVTLWGACAAQTRLTASSPGPLAQGVITVPSADTRVANLSVGPAELPGIVAYGDRASLSIDGIVIDDVRALGLWVSNGSRIDARALVVSGTRANGAGLLGRGVQVESGGTLDVRRGWLSENRDIGVFAANEGSSLALSDVVVRATRSQLSDSTGGSGLAVLSGAAATVTRALFARNRDIGLFADGEGTSLTLSDVVIEGTQAQESDGGGGRGLNLQSGAMATVTRTRLVGNREAGAFADGEGTSLALSDVVIEGTQSREADGTWGRGLNVQSSATATVTRARLVGNRELGIFASHDGTSLTLSDVVIEGTQPRETDGRGGRGLNVELGAVVTVTRARLSRNREIGIFAHQEGTSLSLSDVVIEDTRAQESDGTCGRGLVLQSSARATVTRALLERNRQVGVFADGGDTSLTLSDAVVRDTQAQESDGAGGPGLAVQHGAAATVTRARLARNRQVGVVVYSLGTAVELLDVVVAQTDEQACADTTCRERAFGMGLVGTSEASLSATRFAVQDGALCGVMVAEDAQVDLAVGEVSGFLIGACVQEDGYSVARLTDRVRYLDNDTNLDTTTLPVPGPTSPLDPAP